MYKYITSSFLLKILVFSLFFLISIFYLYIGFHNNISGLFSDSVHYLFMADYFSFKNQINNDIYQRIFDESSYPPLYPLVLSFFGGSTSHIQTSHFITSSLFIFSLISCYLWLRSQQVKLLPSAILTLSFSMTSAVFLHSFFIASEYLYLFITLLVFIVFNYIQQLEKEKRTRLYILAASLISLAILTRSIGIALLPAFFIGLLLYKNKIYIALLLSIITYLPMFAWHLLKREAENTSGHYDTILQNYLNETGLSTILMDIVNRVYIFINSWIDLFSLEPSLLQNSIFSLILLLAVIGYIAQLFKHISLEHLYLFFYISIIIIWPFPYEIQRFQIVIIPFILYFAWLGSSWLNNIFPFSKFIYLAILSITITLSFANYIAKFYAPIPEALEHHRYSPIWYKTLSEQDSLEAIERLEHILIAVQAIPTYIKEEDCVYSLLADFIRLNAKSHTIIKTAQLQATNKQINIKPRLDQCRYVFMYDAFGTADIIYPPFYPYTFIQETAKPVFISYYKTDEGSQPIAILADLNP